MVRRCANKAAIHIVGRRENLLNEIQQQFPDKIKTLKADINDDEIDKKINTLIHSMNGVDIFIITASIVEFNDELDYEPEKKTVAINVKGYMQVINTAWQYFTQKGNGHIVGVTSIAASRGNKTAPAYHASKAFQSHYLESLRVKAKHNKNNIAITELVPGYINTAMGKGNRLFWISSVEKAARQSKKGDHKKKSQSLYYEKMVVSLSHSKTFTDFYLRFISEWLVEVEKQNLNNYSLSGINQSAFIRIIRPYLFISLVGILAFAPVSFMLRALKNDITAIEYPINYFISQCIHNGEIPYWFNTWGMGFPLQSSLTWGIFSTPQMIFCSVFDYNIYTLHIEFIFLS